MHPYPEQEPGSPGVMLATGCGATFGLPVLGPPKMRVLVTLKTSALSCMNFPSQSSNFLPNDKASCGLLAGPRT